MKAEVGRIGQIGLIGLILMAGAAWGSGARVVGLVQPTSGGPMFRVTTGTVIQLDGWYRGTVGLEDPYSTFWIDVNQDGVLSLSDDVAVTSSGLYVMGTLVASGTSTFGDGTTTAMLTQLRFKGDGCTVTLTDEGSGSGYLTIDVDLALGDLTDVDTTTTPPLCWQALVYNEYGVWEPTTITTVTDPLYLRLDGTNSPAADISWDSQELQDVANLWVDDNIYLGFDNPSSNTDLYIVFNTDDGRKYIGWDTTTNSMTITDDCVFYGGFKLRYNPDQNLSGTGPGLEMYTQSDGTALLRAYDRTVGSEGHLILRLSADTTDVWYGPNANSICKFYDDGINVSQGYGLGIGNDPSSYTHPVRISTDLFQASSVHQSFVRQDGDLWVANTYSGGGQDLGLSGFYILPSVRTPGDVNGTFAGLYVRNRMITSGDVDEIAGAVIYTGQGSAASTGNTDNAYGVKIRDWYGTVPGTATNQYGLYIETMADWSNNYQIYSESGNWYSGGGDLTMAAGSLKAGANLYVNQDGPDGDSYVYYYDNSSDDNEYQKWDNLDDRFELSNDLYVGGNLTTTAWAAIGGNATVADNVYVNYGGPDASSFMYFYENSSNTGAYLGWSDSGGIFSLSHGLTANGNFTGTGWAAITGNTTIGGNVYVNYGGPDGDAFLYFYEDGSPTGEHFKWDNADDQFEISDDLHFPAGSGISSDAGSDVFQGSPGHLYVAGIGGVNGTPGTAGTAALNGLPLSTSGEYAFAIPIRQQFVNSAVSLTEITIAGEFDASDYITSTAIWTWNNSTGTYAEVEEDASNMTSTSSADRVSGTVSLDTGTAYYFVVEYVASAGSKKVTELKFGWNQ